MMNCFKLFYNLRVNEYEVDETENGNVLNRHSVYEGGYIFDKERKETLVAYLNESKRDVATSS